jgi:GntR family transcriptional regulator
VVTSASSDGTSNLATGQRPPVVPLYHQLRLNLTEKIESGSWPPGHQMPSEPDLMRQYSVSRATVRQALQLLEREGRVERIKGSGTFVSRPKVMQSLLPRYVTDLAAGRRLVPQVRVVSFERQRPSGSIAGRLALEPDEEVYELVRVLSEDDEPLMIMTSWLPVSRFPGFSPAPFAGERYRSMREVMSEEYGVLIAHQYKEIEITMLDEEDAPLLDSRVGDPALLITYLTRAAGGHPVELRRWVIRGDRCKLYTELDLPEHLF